MNDEIRNPYAQPTFETYAHDPNQHLGIPTADLKKIQAVVKDASQFWLGILLCFLCSGIGMLVIGIWYLVRLSQWNRLASQYPILMQTDAAPGSLPQQFQSSKWKLMTGFSFGAVLLVLFLLLILASIGAGV